VKVARKAGCKCVAFMTSFTEKEIERADWIIKDLTHCPEEIVIKKVKFLH